MASNEMKEFSTRFRVMVVGDKRVGKTSIVRSFLDGTFAGDKNPCSIDGSRSKIVEVKGKKVKLQIMDTISREWHLSVDTIDFRRADAIFICFDVTNLSSFRDTRYWPNRIGDTEDFQLALVGTKCDKISTRVVTAEMGHALALELGALYYETSAKTSSMVSELFHETVSHLLDGDTKLRSNNWDTITLEEPPIFSAPESTPRRPRKRFC